MVQSFTSKDEVRYTTLWTHECKKDVATLVQEHSLSLKTICCKLSSVFNHSIQPFWNEVCTRVHSWCRGRGHLSLCISRLLHAQAKQSSAWLSFSKLRSLPLWPHQVPLTLVTLNEAREPAEDGLKLRRVILLNHGRPGQRHKWGTVQSVQIYCVDYLLSLFILSYVSTLQCCCPVMQFILSLRAHNEFPSEDNKVYLILTYLRELSPTEKPIFLVNTSNCIVKSFLNKSDLTSLTWRMNE